MNPDSQDDIVEFVEALAVGDVPSAFQIADAVGNYVEPVVQIEGTVRDSVGVYLGPTTPPNIELAPATIDVVRGGSTLDVGTLTSLYMATFGRPPDANEMATDLDNARRYGDAGVVRGIQLRAGNVAGSNVRGDEFLPSLQPTQEQVVMSLAGGGISSGGISTTEGWRDVLGNIVGLLPFPGAGQIGDIIGGIIGGGSGLAQPRLPMPAPPQARLPAPRTPPIIDVPMPPRRGGGVGTAARAAAIIAAAAAAGLTVEQYLALHPGARRHRRMNVLNQRALSRAFRRVQGFGHFVKKTIHLEKHAPRPKRRTHKKGRI